MIQRKNEEILTNIELDKISQLLSFCSSKNQNSIIASEDVDYADFCWISTQLPPKCKPYFKPHIYAQFKSNEKGRVHVQQIFSFILRRASLVQERTCIGVYDIDGDGYLTEEELSRYIGDLISTFPHFRNMEEEFKPFYLCGATRKFMMSLDCSRRGRVKITDLVLSPALSEFFELQHNEIPQNIAISNWFSLPYSLNVYNQYVKLDADQNGMLSEPELRLIGNSRYSRLFIERVFQECQTFGGELDYKNYLDFVLSINEVNEPSSIIYIFRLLDIRNQGFLDEFTLYYFLKGIAETLDFPFNIQDLIIEILDMSNAKSTGKVTVDDLLNCGSGGTIISLLIDVQAAMQNQIKD